FCAESEPVEVTEHPPPPAPGQHIECLRITAIESSDQFLIAPFVRCAHAASPCPSSCTRGQFPFFTCFRDPRQFPCSSHRELKNRAAARVLLLGRLRGLRPAAGRNAWSSGQARGKRRGMEEWRSGRVEALVRMIHSSILP